MVIGTQSLYKDILLNLLKEVEGILNDVGHSGRAAGHLVATSGHPHKKMLAPLGAQFLRRHLPALHVQQKWQRPG